MKEIWNQMNWTQNIIENFWKHVNVPKDWETNDRCWEWIGGKGSNRKVYGTFTIKLSKYHKTFRAHRFIYECYNGPIPNDLIVLHKCDNPGCVNPNHLYAGTYKQNTQDMITKNRQKNVKGSDVGTSVLTNEDVLTILNNIENGSFNNIDQICNIYHVSTNTIYRILKRERWTHLTSNYSDQTLQQFRSKIIGNCSNKLNEEIVKLIKLDLKNNISYNNISTKYNITKSNISAIKHNKIWSKVTI